MAMPILTKNKNEMHNKMMMDFMTRSSDMAIDNGDAGIN